MRDAVNDIRQSDGRAASDSQRSQPILVGEAGLLIEEMIMGGEIGKEYDGVSLVRKKDSRSLKINTAYLLRESL